jgi:hypothetical protein
MHLGGNWLLKGYTEIERSVPVLVDVQTYYLRAAPPVSSRITMRRHFDFVIGAYLNEMYILSTRLERYLKQIGRAVGLKNATLRKCNDLFQRMFGDIVAIRGRHVHETRFVDLDLVRLFSLEQFAQLASLMPRSKRKENEKQQKELSKRISSEWTATISKNNGRNNSSP